MEIIHKKPVIRRRKPLEINELNEDGDKFAKRKNYMCQFAEADVTIGQLLTIYDNFLAKWSCYQLPHGVTFVLTD